MQVELFLLIISVLFFVSILVSKAGSKFGVPTLLLFLAVGMIFGVDGFGVKFDNIKMAQTIGTVSLCVILFSGGLDTRIEDIKPVIGPGITLATLGVLITAFSTGLVLYFLMGYQFTGESKVFLVLLLLAATMSSTDSASVFSILRSKGLKLKNNLRPTLELESGSNDPMAYVMTITLIDLIVKGGTPNAWQVIFMVIIQIVVGAIVGFVLGKGLVYFINKINIDNVALYPILVFSSCFFVFAATYYLKGNSYLAVYIAGLVIGNAKFVHKRSTRNFFDGVTWLCQLAMFLTLGLLVNPSELPRTIIPGLIISLVMIFITRPLSVFISLLPFKRYKVRDKLFVSWVGLRGAVPIIFAILCKAAGVPHSDTMFNIVFCCTLVSLILQGTTLPLVAKWLKVSEEPEEKSKIESFDIDFPEEIKSVASEIEITSSLLTRGNRLMDLRMPEQTLVIMVKRGENFFVPTGKTVLYEGDRMMVLSDSKENIDNYLQTAVQ